MRTPAWPSTRARVDILRRTYRRRASRNGVIANCLSLLLVATGAAVGLSPISDPKVTAGLGVTVILLEGIARVMKPALRAAGARRASRSSTASSASTTRTAAITATAAPRAMRRSSSRSSGSWRRPTPAKSATSRAPPPSHPPAAKPPEESAVHTVSRPSRHGGSAISTRRVRRISTRRAATCAFPIREAGCSRGSGPPATRNARPWGCAPPPVRHTDRTNIR